MPFSMPTILDTSAKFLIEHPESSDVVLELLRRLDRMEKNNTDASASDPTPVDPNAGLWCSEYDARDECACASCDGRLPGPITHSAQNTFSGGNGAETHAEFRRYDDEAADGYVTWDRYYNWDGGEQQQTNEVQPPNEVQPVDHRPEPHMSTLMGIVYDAARGLADYDGWFALADVYSSVTERRKGVIRKTIQSLRDIGVIEHFSLKKPSERGRGNYRLVARYR